MNVWKIGAGETGRDYSELYFNHDVMIIGPSHLGDALENPYPPKSGSSIENQINAFASKPRPGDRVIMRGGKKVLGIGQIPEGAESGYSLDDHFRCVLGWELRHCRRVLWAGNLNLGPFKNAFSNIRGSMPTFTELHRPTNVKAEILQIPDRHFSRSLKAMPDFDPDPYKEEDLGIELFAAGISSRNIHDIWEALQQADRLWKWYDSDRAGERPTEHEIVSHMILPVFLGLGWSHQQIAVEWHRVDMAFFRAMPASRENCCMILEAKGRQKPLGQVFRQAKKYVDQLRLRNVKHILTTDGGSLFVYSKRQRGWVDEPAHYMSVWSPQKEYVIPKGARTVDTLVRLQPSAL